MLVLLALTATAGLALEGPITRVHFDTAGLWNDPLVYRGFALRENTGRPWTEVTYAGRAFQAFSLDAGVGSAWRGESGGRVDWTVVSATDTSTAGRPELTYELVRTGSPLEITLRQALGPSGQTIGVRYDVYNTGGVDVPAVKLLFGFDPDFEYLTYGEGQRYNDVLDVDADGLADWVEAVGPRTGITVGIGACSPADQVVGTASYLTDPTGSLDDEGGALRDATVHVLSDLGTIPAGDVKTASFLVAWGTSDIDAANAYTDDFTLCANCDYDRDGHARPLCDGNDCDDTRRDVYPGAPEVCDGVDNDCDLRVDVDAIDALAWLYDGDRDGWGDADRTVMACDPVTDHVLAGDDCYDDDPTTHPGATEVPDHIDNDCDGWVDEETIWGDDDGDGVTEAGGDCDDGTELRAPGLTEVCDGVDQDCDGVVDDGLLCADDDGDGYCEGVDLDGDGVDECTDGSVPGDCDDTLPTMHPGSVEVPDDGLDNDCSGGVDGETWDEDGDHVTISGGDCDDLDPTVRPGHIELEDGKDNDCDHVVDEGTHAFDDDGDGYREHDGDCDDSDPERNPAAPELPDGRDNDCDGAVDETSATEDRDGDGLTPEQGDCDDADPGAHPGADEGRQWRRRRLRRDRGRRLPRRGRRRGHCRRRRLRRQRRLGPPRHARALRRRGSTMTATAASTSTIRPVLPPEGPRRRGAVRPPRPGWPSPGSSPWSLLGAVAADDRLELGPVVGGAHVDALGGRGHVVEGGLGQGSALSVAAEGDEGVGLDLRHPEAVVAPAHGHRPLGVAQGLGVAVEAGEHLGGGQQEGGLVREGPGVVVEEGEGGLGLAAELGEPGEPGDRRPIVGPVAGEVGAHMSGGGGVVGGRGPVVDLELGEEVEQAVDRGRVAGGEIGDDGGAGGAPHPVVVEQVVGDRRHPVEGTPGSVGGEPGRPVGVGLGVEVGEAVGHGLVGVGRGLEPGCDVVVSALGLGPGHAGGLVGADPLRAGGQRLLGRAEPGEESVAVGVADGALALGSVGVGDHDRRVAADVVAALELPGARVVDVDDDDLVVEQGLGQRVGVEHLGAQRVARRAPHGAEVEEHGYTSLLGPSEGRSTEAVCVAAAPAGGVEHRGGVGHAHHQVHLASASLRGHRALHHVAHELAGAARVLAQGHHHRPRSGPARGRRTAPPRRRRPRPRPARLMRRVPRLRSTSKGASGSSLWPVGAWTVNAAAAPL